MKASKKIKRKKTAPYTEESLKSKERQIKVMVSLLESLLILPIVTPIISYLNISKLNLILTLVVYSVISIFMYLLKVNNKNFEFRKCEFLDDEMSIITDRKLDGEISNIYVTKYILILVANVLICIPLSLTFSTIVSSIVAFILGFIVNSKIVTIVKFVLIFIIFKVFFTLINNFFIKYIEKKELD